MAGSCTCKFRKDPDRRDGDRRLLGGTATNSWYTASERRTRKGVRSVRSKENVVPKCPDHRIATSRAAIAEANSDIGTEQGSKLGTCRRDIVFTVDREADGLVVG